VRLKVRKKYFELVAKNYQSHLVIYAPFYYSSPDLVEYDRPYFG
jgi:hypothetical protein